MNWMYALYATYEQNRDYVGRIDKEPAHGHRKERLITPLLPLYHSMQNAHITITLNKQGELIKASINNQNSQPTIIPVTEDVYKRQVSIHALLAECDSVAAS